MEVIILLEVRRLGIVVQCLHTASVSEWFDERSGSSQQGRRCAGLLLLAEISNVVPAAIIGHSTGGGSCCSQKTLSEKRKSF